MVRSDHMPGLSIPARPGWRLEPWMRRLRQLDARGLALFRIGLALVILWDIALAWRLADDWLAMQAFDAWPLPVGTGDAALNLRLALALYALAALAFLCGWRTQAATVAVWLASCGYQYAARYSSDYHNAVLCQVLLWSIALPLGARWSVDALQSRRARVPAWLQGAAATGLLLTIGWIYLSTAVVKDGAAWWSEGSAVRLAISDRAVMRALGAWSANTLPEPVLQGLTWTTLAVEAAVPLLILSAHRRARTVAASALALLHLGMWILMDLGSFPLLMLSVAATVWLPWQGRDLQPIESPPPGAPDPGCGSRGPAAPAAGAGSDLGRWLPRLLAGLLVVNVLLTLDAERQRRWPVEPDTEMARWLRRGRAFLSAEPVWGMYAPEPWRFTGWWVGVGATAAGRFIDPMTQRPPTLTPPGTADPVRWAYLWNPPSAVDSAGVETAGTEDAYLRFLRHRQQRLDPAEPLRWLGLVYVYEPLDGPLRGRHLPLLGRTWPAHIAPSKVAQALGATLYAVEGTQVGDPQWQPSVLARVP